MRSSSRHSAVNMRGSQQPTQPPPLHAQQKQALHTHVAQASRWALGQARAARAADRLRLATAWVSLGHDLALEPPRFNT